MMTSNVRRGFKGGNVGLAIAILGFLVSAGTAGAASLCNDCHGMPPIDAAYRNITTGGFKGSHQTHQPAAATAKNCVICHSAAASYVSGHMNEAIEIAANINTSPTAATYSKGVFFNQTSVPVLGSCSNVNCHFERTTPVWSSAALKSPTDCNACHDAAPRDGNHPAATGAGKKHGDYYGINTSSCVKCHPDHMAAAKPFSHATSAGKRGLIVRFTAAPNTGGTYSGTVTYPNYLPSKAGARNGTCSNLYCHTNGAGGAPIQAAVWGGTLAADCTGCHGGDSASASPIATGKHAAHSNNAAVLGTNIGCVDCHRKTVSGNRTVSTIANHVNTFKEYSGLLGGGTAKYSATAKTCSNIYCHSSGKGTFVVAPAWNGTATMGCNGCHGTTNTFGSPDYANGGAATAMANSHAKHVDAAADCDSCHTTVTNNGTAIKAGSLLHINKAMDVAFNVKSGTAATWTAATKTCANTACHGTAAPVWGGTLPADCTGCHGGTATSSKPIASADHPTHLTAAYGPGAYLGTTAAGCQACHTYNTTGANPLHSNGATEVLAGAGSACANCHAGVVPAWTATTARVACTSCHAATPAKLPNGVAAPYKAQFTPRGHGLYAISCTSCHDQNAAHISGTLGDAVRLFGANDNTRCSGCHSGSFARAMSTHVTTLNGPADSLCKSCHDVHGTTNLGMVKTTINGATITFTNTSTGFVQTTGAYRGLCQVCHTQTKYFKAGDAASLGHNGNRNCLNCHSHTGGYAFQASTSCDSCHGYPPVPAGFKGGLGNYTSAKLEDYAGGSGAHTIPAHVKKTAKASEGWANCSMCHSNGSASPTTHTMNTPVTPSKMTIDVADKYKFNHQLPLGSAQYKGVLTDGGTNATGTCFNTKCHFKPSKKWSTVK